MECPDQIENAFEGLTLEKENLSDAQIFAKYFAHIVLMDELLALAPQVELLAHNGKQGAGREVYLELANGLGAYCIAGSVVLWAHTDAAEFHSERQSRRCELTVYTVSGFEVLDLAFPLIVPVSETY